MKIMHLSDLHIGKQIYEQSLIEDQSYILNEILKIMVEKNVEVIMICGDIYDRSVPPSEAIKLFDSFLTSIVKLEKKVLIIAGNHDSKERLSFANKILEKNNIFIETNLNNELRKISIDDIDFYLLPFIKPIDLKDIYNDVTDYTSACKKIIDNTDINQNRKNIILSHQFVTGTNIDIIKSDSEVLSLGGMDNVDISVYDKFDYVALGHIHRSQKLIKDTVRYSGSILKYSFSESKYPKTVPIIDSENMNIELIPLSPLHDLIDIEGNMETLLKNASDDYVRAILTDEEELYDPINELRKKYPNILKVEFKNRRTIYNENDINICDIKEKSILDLFEEFYLNQNNISLNNDERDIINEIVKEVHNETINS